MQKVSFILKRTIVAYADFNAEYINVENNCNKNRYVAFSGMIFGI